MEKRIAILGIMVDDAAQTAKLNELLGEYREYIIGRMGLPHQLHNGRKLSLISIAIEAPGSVISALSGKLGMLPGVNSKALYYSEN